MMKFNISKITKGAATALNMLALRMLTLTAAAIVTVTAAAPARAAEATAEPRYVSAQEVVITPSPAIVEIERTLQLQASVLPSGASQTVTWSVQEGDRSVATLSSRGLVTGLSEGIITVRATASNGVYAQTTVKVYQPMLDMVASVPAKDATDVTVFVKPSVEFSHALSRGVAFSSISLVGGGSMVPGAVTIEGCELCFTPDHPLKPLTTYTFTIPAGAVTNKWEMGNYSPVIIAFTTGERERLELTAPESTGFLSKGELITLECSHPEAAIHYTTDGTTPTTSSLLYTQPLVMDSNFHLMAFATLEGYEDSYMLDREYRLSNSEPQAHYPAQEGPAVYGDVIPSLRFGNLITPSDYMDQIRLAPKGGDPLECEYVVADSTIFIIPAERLRRGLTYEAEVPADAVRTVEGEPNKPYSWTFGIPHCTTSIAMGANEIGLALSSDTSLQTWGQHYVSGDNSSSAVTFSTVTTPKTFISDGVEDAAGGFMHHALLRSGGALWVWGRQYCGELGLGSRKGYASPQLLMEEVKSASAGGQTTAIVKKDGTLWMCGRNDFGQVGDGTFDTALTPVQVMEQVATATAGWCASFAVKTDGTLWAWGRNDRHQLGDGSTELRRIPVKILDDVALMDCPPTEGSLFAALSTAGTLWAWGGDDATPQKVAAGVCAMAVGVDYVAYVDSNGDLWAYGANDYGQLGTGDTAAASAPVKIMEEVTDVVSGGHTTMALREDGSVWTWGRRYGTLLGRPDVSATEEAYAALPACIIEGESSARMLGLGRRKNIAMEVGAKAVAEMRTVPANARYDHLEWVSAQPEIASVDERGVVTGLAEGRADITCTATDLRGRSFSTLCRVYVGVEPEDSGLADVLPESSLRVWGASRVVCLEGLLPADTVSVFDTMSRRLYGGETHESSLRVAVAAPGVYLVRVGSRRFKVLCR